MGPQMKVQLVTAILAIAFFAIPAAVPANQPEVKVMDLKPAVQITAVENNMSVLLRDPFEAQELTIDLPTRFTAEPVDLETLIG